MVSIGKDKADVEAAKPLFAVENMWVEDYEHPKVVLEIDK
jgi:hypothetical protein